MKKTCFIISIITLAACTSLPPKPLRGDFVEVSPDAYQKNPIDNLTVRWTGFVIDVENKEEHSCLTIIAKMPDQYARPSKRVRLDQGRFIACKPKFLEPEFFNEKAVTVTGPVKRMVRKPLGNMEYNYPLVDAQVIYVW